ncbi:unnamed protein product [Spirodela intermedia]|uniref:Uncharacterized protein n=1 Tax=Spirodela intermedia TaxID=51605 RepID=A0A7I8JS47_SPIIN|nr:unnamed protein product [Spirodela intermedia]CAA6673008.1 unnamed protein product [Spirodela intermedia]
MESRGCDSEVVRRRMSRIADHVAGCREDVAQPHRQLLPVNCSSTLNAVTPRRDSRTLFARQGSASQACFMRQVSVAQGLRAGGCAQQSSPINCLPPGNGDYSSQHSGGPLFARPSQRVSTPPLLKIHQPTAQENTEASTEQPRFARPGSGESEKEQLLCNRAVERSSPGSIELPPRMDVAETGVYHVLTLELPGANIVDIKVEVDDKNLTVTGKRSSPRWRMEAPSEDASITYHQKQILQGPYSVVWPLPSDVNRDSGGGNDLPLLAAARSCLQEGLKPMPTSELRKLLKPHEILQMAE